MELKNTLYEPKVVEHLRNKIRRFETDEMVRKLREARVAMKPPGAPQDLQDNKPQAA